MAPASVAGIMPHTVAAGNTVNTLSWDIGDLLARSAMLSSSI